MLAPNARVLPPDAVFLVIDEESDQRPAGTTVWTASPRDPNDS
jgi:hypothetical protein